MGQYVCVLNTLHTDGTPQVYKFAMGPGIAFTDDVYADGCLMSWQGATEKVEANTDGVIVSSYQVGQIEILNQPASIASAGLWDELMSRVMFHAIAQLYWCPTRLWADAVLVCQGQMMQPVANLSTSTSVTSTIRIPLRDPRSQLQTALQTATYGGTNVDGTGIDGDASLKGKTKPILYGIVSNIPGVQVNAISYIYQIADRDAAVLCVRDGGVPLTRGVTRGSLASLIATSPAPGSYDLYSDNTSGCFIKLGTIPLFKLGIDAAEGAAEANRTHAQIWSRLSTDRCNRNTFIGGVVTPLVDTTSIAAADALDGHEVGWWWAGSETCQNAIDAVLGSLSGFEFKDIVSKKWKINKLLAPSGTPKLNLRLVTPAARFKASDRPLLKLDAVQPSYLPNGIQPWQVNVEWGQNYQVMAPADFAGAANPGLKTKFATQWRTEVDQDSAVYALFVSAAALTIPTGYQPGPDGLTCPHAQAEAARIRALYTLDRAAYQASFRPKPGDTVQVGDVIELTYPMYGLSLGKSFVVTQAADLVQDGVRVTTVILSLQSTIALAGTPVTSATVGTAYAGFTVSAVGGVAGYVYSVVGGSLPPGVSLNSSTGAVSGTPTVGGVYTATLGVTDAVGATAQLTFTVVVTSLVLATEGGIDITTESGSEISV